MEEKKGKVRPNLVKGESNTGQQVPRDIELTCERERVVGLFDWVDEADTG